MNNVPIVPKPTVTAFWKTNDQQHWEQIHRHVAFQVLQNTKLSRFHCLQLVPPKHQTHTMGFKC